jgi:hypothetical protein
MSPSEWSARGDSNPDLHGLSVPRLPIAPRADGDHGRTRTATGQALDLLPLPDWATWPLVPLGGLEPRPRGLRARHAPLTLQRGVGANGGIRTRTSRLGRPAGSRYPTFATSDRCRSPAHRHPSVVKDPALASWWAARDSNPNAPVEGERGYGPSADHPHVPPHGDSARIRTRTLKLWRLGCSVYTTLPMSLHVSNRFEDRTSPPPDADFLRASGQNKKGLLGDRPRRPVSQ